MFALYQPHQLTYKGEKIQVWHIEGLPKSIAIDSEGFLYCTWWESQGILDSRAKRKKKKWRIFERHHHRYSDIFALFRGLEEAISKTQIRTIPTLQQLQQECQDIHIDIIGLRQMTPSEMTLLRAELSEAHKLLEKAKREELQEAAGQISCCIMLRDSLGRLNVGALRARLSAVDNRFLERLAGIFAWVNNYAAWRQAIENFTKMNLQNLKNLEQNLSTALKHPLLVQDKAAGKQQGKDLIARLNQPIGWLTSLSRINGFSNWAKHYLTDLKTAPQLILDNQFEKAKNAVTRLLQSVKLKQIQFFINDILLTIGLDLIHGDEILWQNYQGEIERIIDNLAKIDEQGFKNPVCNQIKDKLTVAVIFLEQVSDQPNAISQVRAALRQALALF